MNGETTTETPTVEAPAYTPPPVAPEPENKNHQDIKNPWLILVVIVAIILLAIFVWPGGNNTKDAANDFNKTSFEDISGVQGMVRYIDYANQKFTTERIVLLEEGGEFSSKRDVFNFKWDENTEFLYYRNSLALGASQPWKVDMTFLTTTRNIIVTTKEKPDPEKVLTALEIKILPGSTQAVSGN